MNTRVTWSSIRRYIYRPYGQPLMKKDFLPPDFPSWKHLLGPLGPRSLASALAKVRHATLNQMEAHLGRFPPAPLLQQQAQGPNSRDRVFCLSRTFWCFLWQM